MPARAKAATLETLTQRIHRVYDSLPEGERKAADLVLDMPGELATWAASELAEQAGISNATVSRFVRRLGYRSYEEARRASRAMRASGSPLYLAEGGQRTGKPARTLERAIEIEKALIDASVGMQNPLTIDAVATCLAGAARLRVAGFRNSYFLAEYARTMMAQFRPGVEMLNAPGQTLAEGIATVGPGDAVLIVGLRRRPAGFTDFVRAVAATGADVVLLADLSIRGAPAEARWTLNCAVETPQAVDSYVGVLAILRTVALVMLQRLDARGRRHLERIEQIHANLSELE
ncbi:MurR/RpiR family transcriptional regulator [Limibaculum sp. M0105]|uniref:MurR/RpiR family transcriptional regulator n=1 Tax=Thermohalobaculum xanthum TaxID=2753746 RepID=A0A8J7SCR5_9RHOB|nr:MurR/RpiR family transcriptional regulator [Thermohalobaculum xanthum]MBK0398052.1 MurR/RpiR family transcriptional regulator [Thermohalobaculum xanthum]